MGHIKYRSKTRAEATPHEWLKVGAQIGTMANVWAGRGDLVAYVGPGAGGPAPACYTPATAEVEVNVDIAFGPGVSPEHIEDLRERENHYLWPKAVGAVFHEALHARFSNWDIEQASRDLSNDEFSALVLLEEGRIEAQGLQLFPENSGFIRATVLEIVLADLAETPLDESSTKAAASLAALAIARVDAGSVAAEDVAGLTETIINKLGEARLARLRELWLKAQQYEKHHDAVGMYDLAREWVRIVDEAAEENGDANGDEPGAEGSGSGDGSTGSSAFVSGLMDELRDAAESATVGAMTELGDQQLAEEWREEAKERASDASIEREHRDIASEVFGKGTGPLDGASTRSRLAEVRKPRGDERQAAVKVAQMLEKAKYRERDAVEISSVVPPGRLRTRAMVQGAALKSKGVMTQVEPWRRTVRKHVDDPTLTIGIMVDISGSMSDAMAAMATTAWVMSESVRRVQGRAAMVYYGNSIFPTLKPGQHLTDVNVYTAPDGTEKFNDAFKALNGGVNLLHGRGARLLVIVSDGEYVPAEEKHTKRWLTECKRAGVGVLWLAPDNGRSAYRLTDGTGAVVLTRMTDPVGSATEIGRAAAKALTAVG